MKFKDIPLTWLSCIFVLLAMLMSYLDINGLGHSILGLVCGYFFRKSFESDMINKRGSN